MKLFLATGNKHKIEEISKIFKDMEDIEILSIKDGIEIPEVIEDGETFEENSYKKASAIAKYIGMPTIADDSGLCVEALNGAPGVYSARFSEAGTDIENNKKLQFEMRDKENRDAKFVSVITLCFPDGKYYNFRGEVEGIIISEARGKDGFGYDPYFYIESLGKTFAEMGDDKNSISHRARALEKLKKELPNIF